MKFTSLIQYPMGVDYALSSRLDSKPKVVGREELEQYLREYRREDALVYIPDDELPDQITFRNNNSVGENKHNGSFVGSYLFYTFILEWKHKHRFHRDTGPALITMSDYKITFLNNDIIGVTCGRIQCDWYQNGFLKRDDGPRTVRFNNFIMNRKLHGKDKNRRFSEPRLDEKSTNVIVWDTQEYTNYAKPVAEKLGIKMNNFAVHGGVYDNSMDAYLLAEEIQRNWSSPV